MTLQPSNVTRKSKPVGAIVSVVVVLLFVALGFLLLPGTSAGDSIAAKLGYEPASRGKQGISGRLTHPLSANVNNLGQQYCVNELDQLLGTLPTGNFIGYNLVTDDADVAQSFIVIQNQQLSLSVNITTIPQQGKSCTFSVERTRVWGNTCPQLQENLFPQAELVGNLNGRWLLKADEKQYYFLERINDNACMLINKRLLNSDELAVMLRSTN